MVKIKIGRASWIKNEIGNRYGRLIVLELSGIKKWAFWLCKCDCGEQVKVSSSHLRNGSTRSCGCLAREESSARLRKQLTLPSGVAAFRRITGSMKRHARERNYEWMLNDEQVKTLTKQNCYYCGEKPSSGLTQKKCNGIYIYNGLDRIDNNKGYIIENVVSCCGKCNKAKTDMNIEEFEKWIVSMYDRLIQRTFANIRIA